MIIVPFCKCIVITREFKKEDGFRTRTRNYMIIVPFCKCIVITREFKKEDGYVGVELCLTFKKGFVIGRSHCGHHMWRDGFTDKQ